MERHEKTLLAAHGYAELGMFDDALAELETLPPEARGAVLAVEMRVAILMQAKRWRDALGVSEMLCKLDPARSSGFIHAAFCLHELGRTADARDTLLKGPATLHAEATFHYNLACYECALGQLGLARAHLEKSFTLDRKFREFAKTDPDLKPLRD
jgi:predicted Zn-dependent protease